MSITTDESEKRDAVAWLENFRAAHAGWRDVGDGVAGPVACSIMFYFSGLSDDEGINWYASIPGRFQYGFSTPSAAWSWIQDALEEDE